MSYADCIAAVKTYIKESGLERKIPSKRIDEIAQDLTSLEKDLNQVEFQVKVNELVDHIGNEIALELKAANARNLLQAKKNAQNTLDNIKLFEEKANRRHIARLIEQDPKSHLFEAARATVQGGSLLPGKGTNLGLSGLRDDLEFTFRKYWNSAVHKYRTMALSAEKLQSLRRDIFMERDALERGLPLMRSGNVDALEIAKAMHQTSELMAREKMAVSPFVKLTEDRLVKGWHNREKISAGDKQEWIADAYETFGKKSFVGKSREEAYKVLSEIHDRIRAGEYTRLDDAVKTDQFVTVYGRTGSVEKRLASSRSLIPENWEKQFNYMEKWGYDVMEGMDKEIRENSKLIAGMKKWGPKTREAYEGWFKRVTDKLPLEDRDYLKGRKSELDRMFINSTQPDTAPAVGLIPKLALGSRALSTMWFLGKSLFRTFQDAATSAGIVRSLDRSDVTWNALSMVGSFVHSFAPYGQKYAREMADKLGLFTDIYQASLAHEVGSASGAFGTFTKMAETLGNLNLMRRQTVSGKVAVAGLISNRLAGFAEKEFSQLPDIVKEGLLRYDIGEFEWNAVRKFVEEFKGRKLLTPDSAMNMTDETVQNYLKAKGVSEINLDSVRSKIRSSLSILLNEHADLGVSMPGERTRFFLHRGTSQNDGWGILMRQLTQFLSASVVQNDVGRRMWYSGSGPRGDLYGLSSFIMLSSFLYAISEYARQAALGKTPEDPRNPTFLAKVAIGGMGLGIQAEHIANALFYSNNITDAAKNMAGLVSPSGEILAKGVAVPFFVSKELVTEGKVSESTKRQAVDLGIQATGITRLFYTQALFDYYFGNVAREWAQHGYIRDLNARTKETPGLLDKHQEYFMLKPTRTP